MQQHRHLLIGLSRLVTCLDLARRLVRLLVGVLLLASAYSAHAGTAFCSSYPLVGGFHVIDGNDPALNSLTLPSSIGIDSNCYFKNFQISSKWPQGLTSTLNFKSDGFVAVFENVYYSGNMACATTTTKIWFVNNAQYSPNNSCQSLFIPVETIGKQTPGPTASVGVPFTYTLTVPVMYDPASGTYYFQPSANTLSNATIYDDLTAVGAAMTYVSNTAFLVNGGTRTPLGSLTLGATPATLSALGIPASDSTKHIVFSSDFNASLTNIQAGTQVEIQMTVVLDNVPANAVGTSFINTAKWWFGRYIGGVAYNPLPGQSGVSAPMSIAEPNLTLTKSSTSTNLNVGAPANFTLNVQNTGGSDAWNTTLVDNIPSGMCATSPLASVTAQVFAADGVTPVSGVLLSGTDFTATFGSIASGCQLNLNMLSAAAKIGPTQRLLVRYQAWLDAGTAPGLTFTNLAAATQWYSASSAYAGRRQYNRTLTNGTPGTLDFQDAYTITSTTQGYFFLKSVSDLTTGLAVADGQSVLPGDRLRYTFQIQNFTFPTLSNISVSDDFDALNASAAFVPGTLALASSNLPAGVLSINPTGGSKGTGSFTISGLALGSNQQYQFQLDITVAASLANGTVVYNQGTLSGTDQSNKVWSGVSDDPYINGPSLLGSTGDRTPVTIQMPGPLGKANTQSTATIGEQFRYRITIPSTPLNVPLYDVKILDALPANLSYVSASVVSGGSWTLSNGGTAGNLVLQDANTGIDIPANGQAVIDVTVVLQNTSTNSSGATFSNTASYTYNKVNGDNTTQGSGGAGSTAAMTVVEPKLAIAKTVAYAAPTGKGISTPAAPGDVLQYTVTVTNSGTSMAYDADVQDLLPVNLALVANSATATINGVVVSGFVSTPTTLASGALDWGGLNSDGSLDIPVGGKLVLTYQATVVETNGTPIVNTAYASWTSLNGAVGGERTGAGCPSPTAPNVYCTGPGSTSVNSIDPTALAKTVISDSWATAPSTATDATLRVGDTVVYTLALTLREGTTQNVVVTDSLPAGMAFDSVVAINGQTTAPYTSVAPFTYSSFAGPTVSGNTVNWNLGNIANAVDNNPANNTFVIQYRARVTTALPKTPTVQVLANNATLSYAINGVTASKAASASVNAWQPLLNVSKAAAPAAGGTVLVANEQVTYTVNISNTGNAPAYNAVLQDILPLGMRNAGVTTVSVTLVNAGTALPALAPSYNNTTGVAVWNFVSGAAGQYAIPPGETLRVVYTTTTDATLGAGMILANQAQVQHYYSLDSLDPNAAFRQDYGTTGTSTVQLTTAAANALAKQGLVSSVAIGQPFTYRVTIPATPQPTALYDVQVVDDIGLGTTGVSLAYLSSSAHLASNSRSWSSLTNTGTATGLVLQDTSSGGLDIPAGDQLIVDVVLVLKTDTVNNTAGKQFQNTATYKYDGVNNNSASQANGAPGTSGAITIVAPNLTLQKSGPATMRAGVASAFSLNVQNTGGATAWKAVITDVLPNVTSAPTGGMCAAAPTNLTAGIYQSNGTTLVSPLVNGTDYSVSFAPAPACTLTVSLLTPAAAIAPTNRLIVGYNAQLDPGTAPGIKLSNVAGATQWLSADPSAAGATGNVQTYSNTLSNGTPGVLDFQDIWTVTTEAPVLTFTKSVFNVSTGQSGANARPGDTLQYTLNVTNVSPVPATNFTLTDDLDALNNPAMFTGGTLTLVSVPAGGNASLTSTTGGSKGTGLVSISGLNVDAKGGANASATIVFTVKLAPAINNSAAVLNQASIASPTLAAQLSDDPATAATPDPTRTLIASAPLWRVLKTVQDVTSGTSVVMPGDVLRYTITVKNVGTENATGVTLADAVPNFTGYVAGSTRLNGNLVADPAAGVSALQNGMLINAPGNTTAGAMNADAGSTTSNVATVTFDVKVNTGAVGGAIISNQGFVNGSGAGGSAFPTAPSDDPVTATVNDPTRVIVGNLPLLNATKTVALVVDTNGNGAFDPGDVVRYTITVNNYSGTPATNVTLTDATPANTSYVANTVSLNGVGVGQPDGGVSPLIAGIGINSPGAAAGTIAAGGQAVVSFNVQINAGVAGGTVISNQGNVATPQLPTVLTDADGNASNGYQPTIFVVGSAQQLSIAKSVTVVGGGAALPGSQLEYLVTVTNTGTVAATNVVLSDDLGQLPLASQAIYVAGSATLNGAGAGVSLGGTLLQGNYGATYGNLLPGATAQLRFRMRIGTGVLMGTNVTNQAQVAWNNPALTATADVSVSVGGIPGAASLNGRVWDDPNFNRVFDTGEASLAGWTVDVLRNNVLLGNATTDANGQYSITGLAPSTSATDQYALRFNAPGATATTAKLGRADSPYVNGLQSISGITAGSGSIVQNLNLPLSPNGVVYNSIVRTPATGILLQLVRSGSAVPLPSTCFDDPAQQGQITLPGGYYRFDLNFGDPSCPSGGDYLIQVTAPSSYAAGPSKAIPPVTDATTLPLSVPNCPGSSADAVPTTTGYCEAQASPYAPGAGVPVGSGTSHYLRLSLGNAAMPGTSQIYNNHIAIDPVLSNAVSITKVAGLQNVTKGQLVPYTITVSNTLPVSLTSVSIVDNFPAGFKYVPGSGRVDGVATEPVAVGNQLSWGNLQLSTNTKRVIQLMLIVGAGVTEGKYINRAQVFSGQTGGAASGEATAAVRVVPDPTLDCSDIIGKVFDDANLNGYQDEGEKGLPGVRLVTARGLVVTADQYGRFHLTCAVVPDPDRGSNFILKVDDRSLPSGYRMTTENPRVQRVTRGKMSKFNFGATIHRVVKLELSDGVFEADGTEVRVQWRQRLELLLGELRKSASVLRLSYLAETESESLVKDRLELVKRELIQAWKQQAGPYDLSVETEVFWRMGGPR
jgi:uncharacterized repeat protein (TIGR01451 family)/fimbrial isopeptide formation D2 family protein